MKGLGAQPPMNAKLLKTFLAFSYFAKGLHTHFSMFKNTKYCCDLALMCCSVEYGKSTGATLHDSKGRGLPYSNLSPLAKNLALHPW